MSSFSEQANEERYAAERERVQKARELCDEWLGIIEEKEAAGEDPLAYLMYRTGDYEHPIYRRPEELAHKLSGEQIAELIVAATDDAWGRFEALNDFASIFAREAMSSAASSVDLRERIATAFELQSRATKELVRGVQGQIKTS